MSSRSKWILCCYALLIGLTLGGCRSMAVRDYVKMTGKVAFGPQDRIAQATDARTVFALLKEPNNFPDENFSDVLVRDESLELVGPLGAQPAGIDNDVLQAREDAIAHAIPGANAGASVTRAAGSDDHGVIWFNKISAIELSRMTLFLRQPQGYVKDMNGYICFLRMSDGGSRYFRSANEGDIKRLAAAFSRYSGIPVTTPDIYPKAGARISLRDGALVAVEFDGPFDRAGIPAGSQILAIDGGPSKGPVELNQRLSGLQTGTHQIKFEDPITMAVQTKAIALDIQP